MEGGECLKPRAGPSLEVFRVMFLLALTITFLHSPLPPPVVPSHFSQARLVPPESSPRFINGLPPLRGRFFDPVFIFKSRKYVPVFF